MKDQIIMYGADWCKDCIRAKEVLAEQEVPFTFLDITDPEKGKEYSEIVMNMNDGKRIIPTFVIDGKHYANPGSSQLATLLRPFRHENDATETRCSNGHILENGDTVLLTRDLDVKGSQLNLKQGTAIEKIKLTGDPAYIDAKIGKSTISIKTEFVKKKS